MEAVDVHDARDDLYLLDVREPYEWAAGHIEASVHIPMGDLNARIGEVPRDATIVFVCRVGARSLAVADALVRAGYIAHNLDGGVQAWQVAGLPLVTDDGGGGTVV